MPLSFSVTVRNARLDAIETAIGTIPILKIRSGSAPANTATADSGAVLATLALPSDWLAAASAGSKAIAGGPWQDSAADAAGTAGHFRIYAADGATCHLQGSIQPASVGGGDMILDNVVFAVGQAFTITAFTLTDGNG